ncbi:MAG TPA: hypothetical protein VF766_05865, partial [Pyrinomonadaceae bacterium]
TVMGSRTRRMLTSTMSESGVGVGVGEAVGRRDGGGGFWADETKAIDRPNKTMERLANNLFMIISKPGLG